jgi:hypothetical protein
VVDPVVKEPLLATSAVAPEPLLVTVNGPEHPLQVKKKPLIASVTELIEPVFWTWNVTVFPTTETTEIESAKAAVLIIRSITAVKTRSFFIFNPLSELVWKRRSGSCLESDLPPFPLLYNAIKRPQYRFGK